MMFQHMRSPKEEDGKKVSSDVKILSWNISYVQVGSNTGKNHDDNKAET